jgi:TetR/AcrR family transcriptional regulator
VAKQPGGPGRPRQEARALAVREALLQAARDYFSSRGFQKASLRAIASRAKVNPAMVHYYFGNKEGLFITMLSETVGPLINELESLNERDAGPDALRGFLRHYARTLLKEPWLPNLLVREVMFQEGAVREAFIGRFASRASGSLRGLLERDVEGGDLPGHVDPVFGALGILSLIVFPFIAQPAVERAFKLDIDEDFVERLTDHTVALFFGAANEPVHGDPECEQE